MLQRLTWLTLTLASALYLWCKRGEWPFDTSGRLKLWDFATVWGAGRKAIDGAALSVYDRLALADFVGAAIGQRPDPNLVFAYPPTALLLVWPLGFLSYSAAMVAYIILGAALWFAVLNAVVRDRWLAAGMTLALGGATHSIYLGQNGFYTAALLTGGLVLLPTRPRLAGILFGILTFKPHLGVALAIALVVWRQWQAIAVAVLTAALLAVLATAVFGVAIWPAYVDLSTDLTKLVIGNENLIDYMFQSVFALLHDFAGAKIAMSVQAAVAMLALGGMVYVSFRTHCPATRSASVIAATLLITPYLFVYDATMLTGAAAFLIVSTRSRIEMFVAGLAATLPSLWFLLNYSFVPLAAWIMLSLCLIRSIRAEPQPMATAAAVDGL